MRKKRKEGESKREKEKEIIPLLSWVKFQKKPYYQANFKTTN